MVHLPDTAPRTRTVDVVRSLTILTAVSPASAEHLPQTAANVAASSNYLRGQGWEVDWVLTVDGPGRLPRYRSAENVTVLRAAGPVGVAAARNLALGSGRGAWIVPLDADDLLNAPAVAAAFDQPVAAAAAWIVGNHGDVETRTVLSRLTSPLACSPGQLGDLWHRGWPFDAGTVLARRDAVLAVGGWPAVSAGEETGLLLNLSESFPGACVPNLLGYRRTWSAARSARPGWAEDLTHSTWVTAAMVNAARGLRHPHRAAVHPPGIRR